MPAIPIIAAVAGPVAGAAGASAATAGLIGAGAAGLASAYGANQANKAANNAANIAQQAANAPAPTVNIADLQSQAQSIAADNAARSAALEAQYNPGAAELRGGSLKALLASLGPQSSSVLSSFAAQGSPGVSIPGARPELSGMAPRPDLSPIAARPATSAANSELLSRIASQAGQPLTNNGFDSALTRQAVARAASDLALGGELPQDVRNLIARRSLSNSGAVTGGLSLGRDLTARDLGLTSLDIRNQRLQAASQLGSQEAALEQANAAMRAQAEQYGRNNLFQSQGALGQQDALVAQNYATDAQIKAAQDALRSQNYSTDAQVQAARNALVSQNYATDAGLAAARDALNSSNYFNQGNLLQNIQNGNFSRLFQAAQLGQNIAQPQSGLDPGSIANLAVGNANATAAQRQQAAALGVSAANQKAALGANIAGAGLGFLTNYLKPANFPDAPTALPAVNYGNVGTSPSGYYAPPLGGNASSAAYVRGN